MTHDAARHESDLPELIDISGADASTSVVFDAAVVVDGVAAASPPLIVARLPVTPSIMTQVIDAGIDPSATTDRSHDDSPMLPERPDHNDHHS